MKTQVSYSNALYGISSTLQCLSALVEPKHLSIDMPTQMVIDTAFTSLVVQLEDIANAIALTEDE